MLRILAITVKILVANLLGILIGGLVYTYKQEDVSRLKFLLIGAILGVIFAFVLDVLERAIEKKKAIKEIRKQIGIDEEEMSEELLEEKATNKETAKIEESQEK